MWSYKEKQLYILKDIDASTKYFASVINLWQKWTYIYVLTPQKYLLHVFFTLNPKLQRISTQILSIIQG